MGRWWSRSLTSAPRARPSCRPLPPSRCRLLRMLPNRLTGSCPTPPVGQGQGQGAHRYGGRGRGRYTVALPGRRPVACTSTAGACVRVPAQLPAVVHACNALGACHAHTGAGALARARLRLAARSLYDDRVHDDVAHGAGRRADQDGCQHAVEVDAAAAPEVQPACGGCRVGRLRNAGGRRRRQRRTCRGG